MVLPQDRPSAYESPRSFNSRGRAARSGFAGFLNQGIMRVIARLAPGSHRHADEMGGNRTHVLLFMLVYLHPRHPLNAGIFRASQFSVIHGSSLVWGSKWGSAMEPTRQYSHAG